MNKDMSKDDLIDLIDLLLRYEKVYNVPLEEELVDGIQERMLDAK